MPFSDLALSKRLERAEGNAAAQFAEARRRIFPDSGSEWMECAGTYAIFDGAESPVTQTFGLGLFEELTQAALDSIESFFVQRGAPVQHEVSPLAGAATLDLLCARKYRPFEISNVLYRPIEEEPAEDQRSICVRVVGADEAETWARTNALGWSHEHPDLEGFLIQMSAIIASRQESPCFLAEIDGKPGAAATLCLHEGVALFAGAATVPEFRRRGLQTSLLRERMRYARDHCCDIAMIVAEPGGESQRNAERRGFRVAYTRTKWKLIS